MSISKAILLVVSSLVGSGSIIDGTIGGVLFADANQLNNNNDIAKNHHHHHHLETDQYTSSIPNAPNNEGSISSPTMSTIQSPTLKTTTKGRRTTVGEDFWYPLSPSAPLQSEQRLDTPAVTEASSPGLSEEEDTVDNKIAKPFINWNAKPLVSTQGSNHPSKEEFIVNSTTPPKSFVWNNIKPGEEEEDAEVSNVQVSLPVRSPQKEEEEWHFFPSPTSPAASIVVNDTPSLQGEEEVERPFFSSPTPPAASIVDNDTPSDTVADLETVFAKGGKTKTSKSKSGKAKTSKTSTSKTSKRKSTVSPTPQPSEFPSINPSTSDSPSTSLNPSSQPSIQATDSKAPSDQPSTKPSSSSAPSTSAIPSSQPSAQPSESDIPSSSGRPSSVPSSQPSSTPSLMPSSSDIILYKFV